MRYFDRNLSRGSGRRQHRFIYQSSRDNTSELEAHVTERPQAKTSRPDNRNLKYGTLCPPVSASDLETKSDRNIVRGVDPNWDLSLHNLNHGSKGWDWASGQLPKPPENNTALYVSL